MLKACNAVEDTEQRHIGGEYRRAIQTGSRAGIHDSFTPRLHTSQMREWINRYGVNIVHAAIFLAICGATFFVLLQISPLEPFGHDESVYLTKARSWIEGTPADQWEVYRPIGMSYAAWAILHFSDSESAIRMFGIVFGALLPAVVFLLFRRATNLWVALSAAMVVASSPLFLQQASIFFNDVPSAVILFTILWLILIHYQSAGRSNSIYYVAPLTAFAFYLRYGVITSLAMIAIFSYLLLLPGFLKKENVSFSKIGRTAFFAAILLSLHFVYSMWRTGDFFGVLSYAGKAAHPGAYVGEGLVQYLKWLPGDIGGWPLGIAMIIGSFFVLTLLISRQLRDRHRELTWIGSVALASFITTGLLTHAETRYVIFPMIALAGVGVAALYYLLERVSNILGYSAVSAIALALIFFGVNSYQEVSAFYRERERSSLSIDYSRAHEAIRADSGNAGCSLWLYQFLPRASWYTKCHLFRITTIPNFKKDIAQYPDNKRYTLVTKRGDLQITPETAQDFGVALREIFSSPQTGITVYRVTENNASTISTSSPQQPNLHI